MQVFIIGAVAAAVGVGMAGFTAVGVVGGATSGTFQPEGGSVLEYGTTNQ